MFANKFKKVIVAGVMALAATSLTSTAFAGPETFHGYTKGAEHKVDHSGWDRILGAYLTTSPDNRTEFNYGGVSAADKKALKDYIAKLASHDPTKLSRNEAFAYWANLYNAVTIDVILDNYPVKSIMSIRSGIRPGPWKRKLVTVQGEVLSLDDIEHGILREHFKDARVHYAVNCASYGCPNLATTAFTGDNLEEMLDAGARDYVNHDRGARFDGNRLVASSIYKWFKADFGGNDTGVIAHLTKYADPELKARLAETKKVGKYEYSWDLNAPQ